MPHDPVVPSYRNVCHKLYSTRVIKREGVQACMRDGHVGSVQPGNKRSFIETGLRVVISRAVMRKWRD